MFFPRLYDEKRRKKGLVPLREEQNRLFFDGFIRPSIEKVRPYFVHYLPGSYDSVRAVLRIARELSGSAAIRGAAFEVPYSEENLPRLWTVIQEALEPPWAEGEVDSDWDDEADNGRALRRRGSEEEQAVGEGWKPPRIPRAATTEYPVHMLRDSISITSEPRRTSPIFRRGVSDEAWALIERMASNLEDPSRGYGWRVELRITTTLAAQLRPAEEAWWRLVKQANRLSNEPGAVAVTPDRDAFYVLAAGDLNTFPHALARILSAPLAAAAGGKIGLDMARSREQRGFAFFPKDVVDWHELRLHDWATDLLQVPQLVIKAYWLEEASLRQSRYLID
ncbi:hypothetical protein FSARC_9851 [Fusarium sarcochroum]|uniref:Uncharacterized protein n=1 Tax=Fusarium sarcochroum TaxID=1208366 RepID=A0A8H4X5S3_9HYPO|nr:hypothetical protein FSARC_9851 [Fusarium sarcochroum]